jgi:hypothetical protein
MYKRNEIKAVRLKGYWVAKQNKKQNPFLEVFL